MPRLPKNGQKQRKTAKNSEKRLPGSSFGCHGRVPAGIVGRRSPVPTVARTGAEMAKSAVRKGKITLSAASRGKKNSAPLRYQ